MEVADLRKENWFAETLRNKLGVKVDDSDDEILAKIKPSTKRQPVTEREYASFTQRVDLSGTATFTARGTETYRAFFSIAELAEEDIDDVDDLCEYLRDGASHDDTDLDWDTISYSDEYANLETDDYDGMECEDNLEEIMERINEHRESN